MCCEMKSKDIQKLSDKSWMADFEFAVNAITLMTTQNTKLLEKSLFVHEIHNLEKAFITKLVSLQPTGE